MDGVTMSEQPQEYITDALDFENYREYFVFHEDGSVSIRRDFAKHIKNLRGKIHLLYAYLSGESDERFPNGQYSRKSEEDCSYRYIPESLKWEVFERDNFTCKNCGARRFLTIDHITPKSKGGKTTLNNCQTLCKSCNSRKGAK
jgi:hypothetical protein